MERHFDGWLEKWDPKVPQTTQFHQNPWFWDRNLKFFFRNTSQNIRRSAGIILGPSLIERARISASELLCQLFFFSSDRIFLPSLKKIREKKSMKKNHFFFTLDFLKSNFEIF